MPQISVIVPVYNVELYLHRCIDSLLSQTFTDFELILVDDGSTDKSGKICDQYAKKDSRIKVIHKRNEGVSVARNTALEIASGQYTTFCDSDDYCLSMWLEDLINAMRKSNAGLVLSNYQEVDEDENFIQLGIRHYGTWDTSNEKGKIDYIIRRVLGKKTEWNGWAIWASLFHTEFIKKYKIQFCASCANFAEDLGFVLEYLLFCDSVVCIDSCQYCYVQHSNSMMSNSLNIVKLDSLNEVSAQFGHRFFKVITDVKYKKIYPLIHFLIMQNQYKKIRYGDATKRLPDEIEKIQNKKWYAQQTNRFIKCYRTMNKYFDKNEKLELILWNRYCMHRNWKRFSYESAIMYKFFIT